ncbi:putative Aminotransferase class I/classII domain-containing protein [Seiridium unicorne]|uniref:Aminotransferase class I/classII domain-containing protein n=1 Tax=Seiridium unicorne TaxID=138068 RepID=A0ABR2UZB3_9PEZI
MPDLEHINLQLGWPSPSLFPSSHLLQGAANILDFPKKSASALIYGPDAGYLPLRESIAKWLSSVYQSSEIISSDRICVTNGASANLANILARFTEPGYTKKIWMIEPSYFLACPIFMDSGFEGQLRGVPEDNEGIDIAFLRARLEESEKEDAPASPRLKTSARYAKLYRHIIYMVPTFSNPSGKTTSLRRRQELVRLAREFDALVITDDVYDVLRWPEDRELAADTVGHVPPRIVDVDRTLDGGCKDKWGNAVSNSSFSKIIAPGMRVGWAEGTPAFVLALSQLGATRSGGCPTQLAATFVDEMLQSGTLQGHIKDTLIPTYRSRYYALMDAINNELVPLGFEISSGAPYHVSSDTTSNGHDSNITVCGGYFVYLLVPLKLTTATKDLAVIALEKGNLKFAYGEMFQVEGDGGSRERATTNYGEGIRLCWAWHTEAKILEGVRRLAELVKGVITQ